jgi:phospholipase C
VPGRRPARALPYAFDVASEVKADGLALSIANTGAAGAAFNLYPAGGEAGPWYYAVEAGKSVEDTLPIGPRGYDLTLFGPNGFLRGYRGQAKAGVEVAAHYDPARQSLVIALRNDGATAVTLKAAEAYAKTARTHRLNPGDRAEQAWPIADSAHWYDVSLTLAEDPGFLRRLAGHVETGQASLSDPVLG